MVRRSALILVFLCLSAQLFAQDILQLMQQGHWKQARAAVAELARRSPRDANTLFLQARVKSAFGDLDGALADIEAALKLQPNNPVYHAIHSDVLGDIVYKYSKLRQLTIAHDIRRELESVIAADPKLIEAQIGLIQFHVRAPAIAGGDRNEARRIAENISKVDPVRGCFGYALIEKADKHWDRAAALYLKAAQADAHSYDARVYLAGAYIQPEVHNYEAAERYAREAVKLDPTRAAAYGVLAAAQALRGDWNAAEQTLTAAQKHDADDVMPFFEVGRAVAASSPDRAERYLRHYLAHDPEGGFTLIAQAHWHLGRALEQQGHKPEAVVEYRLAVQINPELADARKDLKRLRG